jgi:hypothetical protein
MKQHALIMYGRMEKYLLTLVDMNGELHAPVVLSVADKHLDFSLHKKAGHSSKERNSCHY